MSNCIYVYIQRLYPIRFLDKCSICFIYFDKNNFLKYNLIDEILLQIWKLYP